MLVTSYFNLFLLGVLQCLFVYFVFVFYERTYFDIVVLASTLAAVWEPNAINRGMAHDRMSLAATADESSCSNPLC